MERPLTLLFIFQGPIGPILGKERTSGVSDHPDPPQNSTGNCAIFAHLHFVIYYERIPTWCVYHFLKRKDRQNYRKDFPVTATKDPSMGNRQTDISFFKEGVSKILLIH